MTADYKVMWSRMMTPTRSAREARLGLRALDVLRVMFAHEHTFGLTPELRAEIQDIICGAFRHDK